MPTIAIDYTPAIRQSAGIGRIIRGQVQALIEKNPSFDFRLFVVGNVSKENREQAPLPLYTTPINERNMVRLWHRLNAPLPPIDWFTGGPLDLFHATDFVLAPSQARRKVVTVHDLAFLFYPEASMSSLHRYLNVVVPRSIKKADHILADSQHTAQDLQEQWQIPANNITVVQGAVDHSYFCPLDNDTQITAVRQRYGLGEQPFILALSTLQPRKNFVRLIEAFHLARQEAKLPHQLIIGGKKGWLYEQIFARVQALGLEAFVHFPGFIDDADLPALFNGAEFFAYPSLYEGFGLPILEALACGTPVLTANNSCLPEAGGPGAIYVEAESVESIAEGIIQLAEDTTLRSQLSKAGFQHATRFTWTRSATQLMGAYQQIIGG